MKWVNFERELRKKNIVIFTPLDVRQLSGASKTATRFFLHRYSRKGGPIIKLKRGLYTFKDVSPSDLFIANKLYEPSYVSLGFALSYYGIIPETVYEITSVTTRTKREFQVLGKTFSYRQIRKEAFTGYAALRKGKLTTLIADAEKAFIDFMYFTIRDKRRVHGRINKTKINRDRALKYAQLFNNAKLIGYVKRALL